MSSPIKIGNTFISKRYGEYEIIEILGNDQVVIRFKRTGFVKNTWEALVRRQDVCDNSVGILLYGIGTNDADYILQRTERVDGKRIVVFSCPVYKRWCQVIKRVSNRYKDTTYKNASICEEWLIFSNFRHWVLNVQPNKDWENCHLDKDLLFVGNKHYSPETCVFIPSELNIFLTIRKYKNFVGARYNKKLNKYESSVHNPFTKKSNWLGMFPTEIEAHKAWQAKKHEIACQLADLQQDPRVAKALMERYAPDKDWTNK